jgi:hypothetical protein
VEFTARAAAIVPQGDAAVQLPVALGETKAAPVTGCGMHDVGLTAGHARNPVLHVNPHALELQNAVALAGAPHAFVQELQWLTSFVRLKHALPLHAV